MRGKPMGNKRASGVPSSAKMKDNGMGADFGRGTKDMKGQAPQDIQEGGPSGDDINGDRQIEDKVS